MLLRRRFQFLVTLLLLTMCLKPDSVAVAQVHPYDECTTPLDVANGLYYLSTPYSTTSIAPGCTLYHDIWLRYVAPCAGTVSISTCDNEPVQINTSFAVYSGTCASPQLETCRTTGCGNGIQSTGQFTATAGTTYLIRLGSSVNTVGPVTIAIGLITSPANDWCGAASSAGVGTTSFNTACSTNETAGISCFGAGVPVYHDIWYRYQATTAGNTTFSLCGSGFDTRLAVYQDGCPGAGGALLACNDDAGAGSACQGSVQSSLTLVAGAGTTYYVQVGGETAAAFGMGQLAITVNAPPPPSNDTCANATFITDNSDAVYSNAGTTGNDPVPFCSNMGSDIWFVYISSCDGPMVLSTCGSTFNTVMSVHTGECGLLTIVPPIGCWNDSQCTAGGPITQQARGEFIATFGTVYRIRVGGHFGATGVVRLRLTRGAMNQACADATPLSGISTDFDTRCGSTVGPLETGGACASASGGDLRFDVWFRYTSPATAFATFTTCGSAFDTRMAIYGGTCPSSPGSALACNDDATQRLPCEDSPVGESSIRMLLTQGQQYLIRIGGAGTAEGQGVLTITPPGPPPNDACANAQAVTLDTNFDTHLATLDGPAGCPMPNDVWFTYAATCTGPVTVSTCYSPFDTVLAVYTGTCGALSLVAGGCNDNAICPDAPLTPGITSRLEFLATAGTTYRIRVGGINDTSTIGYLSIVRGSQNRGCSAPLLISLGSTPLDTRCGGMDRFDVEACGIDELRSTRWFAFTPPQSGPLTLQTCGTGYNTLIALYSEVHCTPISATFVGCDGDDCGDDAMLTANVTAGLTYMIAVGSETSANSTGTGTLTLSMPNPCPADWNGDGVITSQDFFTFLVAFFNNNADYNHDGQTTSQDFFIFIADFFTGC